MSTHHGTRAGCPGSWTGRDLGAKERITYRLGADAIAGLEAAAARTRGRSLEMLGRADFGLPELDRDLAPIRHELTAGRGIAVLRRLPVERCEPQMLEALYWGLGLQLGTPVPQSVMGDVLGYVTDVTDREENVRPYRARNSLRIHTDFADLSGLFCIRPAKSGGVTVVVSSLAIHDEIAARRPDLLETLCRGYHFHRLGEQAKGEPRITDHRVPIFSCCDGYITCRYSRAYIMEAERESGIALSSVETEALDLFDDIAYRDDMHASFALDAGEILLLNSHTTLHTRTAFEDWDDPARRRLLLRLWLAAYEPRPVVPEIAIYSGDPNGIPKRGHGEPAGFVRVASADLMS